MSNYSTTNPSWWGEYIQLAQGIHHDLKQEGGEGSPSSLLSQSSSCLIWPPHQSIQPFDILMVSSSPKVTIGPSVTHYMNRSDIKRIMEAVPDEEGSSSTKKTVPLSSSTYQMLLEECFGLITSTNKTDAETLGTGTGECDANLAFKHVETKQLRLKKASKEENDDDDDEESVEQVIENALEGMEFSVNVERLYVVTSVTSALGVNLVLANQHKKIDLLEVYGKKQQSLLPALAVSSNSVKLTKQRHVPVTIALDAIPFHLVNGRLSRLKHHHTGSSRNLQFGSTSSNPNDFYCHEQLLLNDLCGSNITSSDAIMANTAAVATGTKPSMMMRPPLMSSASVPVLNSNNNGNHRNGVIVASSLQSRSRHNTNVKIKQALLIGNNRYSSLPSLRGCHDDVRSMNQFLSRQGFSVDMKFDQAFDDIMGSLANLALEHHAASLSTKDNNSSSSVIVLYFAGYGRRRRISDIADPLTCNMEYEETFVPVDSCSTTTPTNDRERTTAPTSEERNHDNNNEEEGNVKILDTTADEKVNNNKKKESSNTIENKDISLNLLKEWVNQNFSSETTHVMILWDCGGSYDEKLHTSDPDALKLQSRVLPSDDRPPSKQNRPNAIVGATTTVNDNNSSESNTNHNIVVVRSCRVYETSMEIRQDFSPHSTHPEAVRCSGPPQWHGAMTTFLLHMLQNDTYRDIHSSYFTDLLSYITQTNMMTITTSNQKSTRSLGSSNDELQQHEQQHLQISASASTSLKVIIQTLLYSPLQHKKAMNSPKTHLKELRLTAKTHLPRSQPPPPPPMPHVNDC